MSASTDDRKQACEDLGDAIDSGDMGQIVAKHEKMILAYYQDVQSQANKSFLIANIFAFVGFSVLIGSIAILFITEIQQYSWVGLVSGALMEFISATVFFLYSKSAKQFGSFHICLERTHRYLLAYKIAGESGSEKGHALVDLARTMAIAPMINFADDPDVTSVSTGRKLSSATRRAVSV